MVVPLLSGRIVDAPRPIELRPGMPGTFLPALAAIVTFVGSIGASLLHLHIDELDLTSTCSRQSLSYCCEETP